MLAKTLLYASKMQVMQPVLSIVSMLNSPPIFIRPKDRAKDADAVKMKFAHLDGDHLTFLTAYNTYLRQEKSQEWCFEHFINPRAMKITDDVRGQLNDMVEKRDIGSHSLSPGDPNLNRNIKKSLLAGFFSQVAHLEKAGHYQTLQDAQVVALHPSSVLERKAEWVIYHEFVLTSRNYIRTVTEIRPEWLFEVAPQYLEDLDEFPNCEAKRKLQRLAQRYQK